MSYSQRPGVFVSHTTKRRYTFNDRNPVEKRKALNALLHDDAVFKEAAATRAANIPPDTRSPADRIRAEVTHQPAKTNDAGSAMAGRLAELQRQLTYARTAQDRNRIQKRINLLTIRADDHRQEQEAIAARKLAMEAPEYLAAVEAGQQALDNLRFRPDVEESLVQQAVANLEALKATLDVSAFNAANVELDRAYNASKQSKIDALKVQQAELQAQLKVIRADLAPPEAEQAEITEPVVEPVAEPEGAVV